MSCIIARFTTKERPVNKKTTVRELLGKLLEKKMQKVLAGHRRFDYSLGMDIRRSLTSTHYSTAAFSLYTVKGLRKNKLGSTFCSFVSGNAAIAVTVDRMDSARILRRVRQERKIGA